MDDDDSGGDAQDDSGPLEDNDFKPRLFLGNEIQFHDAIDSDTFDEL